MKSKTGSKHENQVDIKEYLALKNELEETRDKYGVKTEEGRISRIVSGFFDKRDNREEQLVDRKKYLLLAVFTGWMGGHRFYAKRYPVAVMYLLLCWTGFSIAMTIVDLMVAIPKPVDENGKILI